MSTKKGDIDADKYPDPAYPAYRHLSTVIAEKQRTRNLPEVYNFWKDWKQQSQSLPVV